MLCFHSRVGQCSVLVQYIHERSCTNHMTSGSEAVGERDPRWPLGSGWSKSYTMCPGSALLISSCWCVPFHNWSQYPWEVQLIWQSPEDKRHAIQSVLQNIGFSRGNSQATLEQELAICSHQRSVEDMVATSLQFFLHEVFHLFR